MKEPIKKEGFISGFIAEKGTSYVWYNNKYGSFTGWAQVHPDDVEFANEITGCTIAEKRADISYYKFRLKQTQAIIKEFHKFLNSLSAKEFNPITKKYLLKISELIEREKEFKNAILKTEDDIRQYIRIKDMTHKKLTGQK